MGISLKTRKKLWGNAANRCAFENCRIELAVDNFDGDDHHTIGDEAHIVSEKISGPRYDENFPKEQIDKNGNLLLLCKVHHEYIDNDVKFYTVDKVKTIKKEHENWVRSSLQPNQQQQNDDELFAEYIDQIEQLASFGNWEDWTECLLGGSFTLIEKRQYDNLVELHKYIFGRVYPKSGQNLINAITQFNLVLGDFIYEFDIFKISDEGDNEYYKTEQLYKLGAVTVEKQVLHNYMLEELIIELTKAGNYLCDQVRKTIFRTYRLKEGILLLCDAPIMGKTYRRFEYKDNEKYCEFSELRERMQKRLGQI